MLSSILLLILPFTAGFQFTLDEKALDFAKEGRAFFQRHRAQLEAAGAQLSNQLPVVSPDQHEDLPTSSAFSWSSCSSGSTPLKINNISVSPAPIVLGQNITVAGGASLNSKLANLSLALTIDKKEGVWVRVPCVDGVGSCSYNNLCSLAKPGPCPPILQKAGIPCACPFPASPAGGYNLPATEIPTKDPGLSWLTSGEFWVKAEVHDESQLVTCVQLYFSLA
jgi:ganglioside GM2 activator